jgi:hypothetical protein
MTYAQHTHFRICKISGARDAKKYNIRLSFLTITVIFLSSECTMRMHDIIRSCPY